MILQDQFVRTVLGPLLIALFAVMLAPSILGLTIYISTDYLRGAEPDWVISVMRFLLNFGSIPSDIIAISLQSLPAIVTAICLRNSRSLSRTGKISFVLLLAVGVLSFIAMLVYNPDVEAQTMNFEGGRQGIALLDLSNEAALRFSITYIFLMLGLQVSIQRQ